MRADLHCHSVASFDAFSTPQQILNACLAKGIDVIAITEHDLVASFPVRVFRAAGVRVITGCEYTTIKGAHIIGLFVRTALPAPATPQAVVDHIQGEGGLVLLPHPFKPGSGYLCTEEPDEAVLAQVDLMELANGGFRETPEQRATLARLAERHAIRLLACSDAHKVDQIGFYVTDYPDTADDALQATLRDVQGTLLHDALRVRPPRRTRAIQRIGGYQRLVALVPYPVKRLVKRVSYALATRNAVMSSAQYETLGQGRDYSS